MSRVIMLAAALLLAGCDNDRYGPPPKPLLSSRGDIAIFNVPADTPAFEREYRGEIRGIAVKVRAKTYSFGRSFDGELTQPDGRWITFEPDKVADKIIDPVLAPLVQGFCSNVLGLDKAFIDSAPNSFIDEAGQKWARERPLP